MNKIKTIIIAGGGTGGHIFPAIAIAQAILHIHKNVKIQFIGALGKMEMQQIPNAGFSIIGLPIVGFNRNNYFKNIMLPFKICSSFIKLIGIFKLLKPIAVIGVGGYSSFPVVRYAQFLNMPTFIHESNALIGKSNLILSKKVTAFFAGSKAILKNPNIKNVIFSGNPIRKSITLNKYTRNEALEKLNLPTSKSIVLIIGGSLGAASINKTIAKNIPLLLDNNMAIIWQTGKENADNYQQQCNSYQPNMYCTEFIQDMGLVYAASDIVISRSGAMAVAELCCVAKPTIFVPYPFAAENHQYKNAMELVENNAALLVEDKYTEDKLIPLLLQLKENKTLQHQFSTNINTHYVANAAELIAQEIFKNIK
ncbi:MAG: undecaprenyldiphospho-muramoylpentapeptide beta-N-acetylglucosaminyltransferase [Sediminibacterium sp.]|nr:undecaprenyldiphospho-muramoylpentapeptide beta-N-acetylglucosaminyltransferase [Sediminibacterium sp.]